MNAITGLASDAASSLSEGAHAPQQFTLRRTGRKALRFTGWQIVEARGGGEAGRMWYDLALYRTDTGGTIVELIARRHKLDEQDICHAEVFDTMAAAATWLETYACANDVPIPADLSGGEGPMASSVLQAVQLRQSIARITDDYHSLLSDVFEVLDLTDPAGVESVAA